MNHIRKIILTIIVFGALFASAWTGPTATPPDGNVNTLLNTSNETQTKTGYLYFPKWFDANDDEYFVDPDQNSMLARIYANFDMRAPKFYDLDNPDYYVDPASMSRVDSIIGTGTICDKNGCIGDCNLDLCEGVTCDDYCDTDGNTRYYDGSCSAADGSCSYASSETCIHGCTNGSCNTDLCAGVTCNDYCSADGNTRYYGGSCSSGTCSYTSQTCALGCHNGVCDKTTSCSSKTLNTQWNTVSSIEQTWSGSYWYPSNTSIYSTTPSTTSCRYQCETGYDRVGSECVKKYNTKQCIESYSTNDEFWWYDSNGDPSELIEVCPASTRSSLTCAPNFTSSWGDRLGCCTPEGTAINGFCQDFVYTIGEYCYADNTCMVGYCDPRSGIHSHSCQYKELGQTCSEDNDCRTNKCEKNGYWFKECVN